jgi:hypothetical protein
MPAKKAKSTGAPVAKTSSPTPAYIKVEGVKYDVTKTATGKIKVTTPTGNVVTFPKGTNVGVIGSRLQSGGTMFGNKSISQKMNAKVTKPKSSTTKGGLRGLRGRGGGAGGAFLENLK